MAAYQCLNCGQIERDDCCEAQELFCVNDMGPEILRLRAELAALRDALRKLLYASEAERARGIGQPASKPGATE